MRETSFRRKGVSVAGVANPNLRGGDVGVNLHWRAEKKTQTRGQRSPKEDLKRGQTLIMGNCIRGELQDKLDTEMACLIDTGRSNFESEQGWFF